jgi:hypothetical protein
MRLLFAIIVSNSFFFVLKQFVVFRALHWRRWRSLICAKTKQFIVFGALRWRGGDLVIVAVKGHHAGLLVLLGAGEPG